MRPAIVAVRQFVHVYPGRSYRFTTRSRGVIEGRVVGGDPRYVIVELPADSDTPRRAQVGADDVTDIEELASQA